MFVLSQLTEAHAIQICGWQYESEYGIYNFPDWETVKANGWLIADSKRRAEDYTAVLEEGRLCGFFHFMKQEDKVLLGLGLAPEVCGKGRGAELMKLIINQYEENHAGKILELEVRAFNGRALKCYLNAGFEITGSTIKQTHMGTDMFIQMRYNTIE